MKFVPQFNISTLLFLTAVLAGAVASIAWFNFQAIFVGLFCLFLGSAVCVLGYPFRPPRSWALITYSFFALICGYVLSYGPATWALAKFNTFDSRRPALEAAYNHVYAPVTGAIITSPSPIRDAGTAYLAWWLPADVEFHDWGDGLGYTSQSKRFPGRGLCQTLLYL